MNKLTGLILSLLLCLFSGSILASEMTPLGYWKTIDDVTGRAQSIIKIAYDSQTKTYQGTIVDTFPKPGEDKSKVCSKCKGERYNKRILGMTIMENFHADKGGDGYYKGGTILDPTSGKIYSCTMQVSKNNKKLTVRGYIGIPLFGRSQTWLRVKNIKGVEA